MTHLRGNVYYANLPSGRKPVLVVSWDAVNRGMQPIVARITARDRERALPTHVALEAGEGGLRETSYVLCHELATLPGELIDEQPVGTITLGRLIEVEDALRRALDLG